MTYTDTQLKQALAKMLPDRIKCLGSGMPVVDLWWIANVKEVLDTELLHLCWLVEEDLQLIELTDYGCEIANLISPKLNPETVHWGKLLHATWQQRTIALVKVKGIEL